MTEVIHGSVSGLNWSAILGTCLIAIAAAVTAAVSARTQVRRMVPATTHALGESPICAKVRPGMILRCCRSPVRGSRLGLKSRLGQREIVARRGVERAVVELRVGGRTISAAELTRRFFTTRLKSIHLLEIAHVASLI